MDSELKHGLENLKRLRDDQKYIATEVHDQQEELLPLIRKEDPDREGVFVTVDGTMVRAKWQQNAAPEDWDLETLIPYLKKKGVWKRVSTEILDQAKLEAEIRAGNLSIRDLRKFKVKGTPPRPFIRLDEVNEIRRRVVRLVRRKGRRP
jgi:hypothetical protein